MKTSNEIPIRKIKYEYFLLLLIGVGVFFADFFNWNGEYKDPDCYMRALRVMDFINTGVWHEVIFAQSNYPIGEILHWTRPMDLLWVALALPLNFFFDLKDAVFYAGALLSPLLGISTVLALNWSLKTVAGPVIRFITIALFLSSLPIITTFYWGRPDHHALLVLLAVLTIGNILHNLYEQDKASIAWAALLSAFMVWVAAEGWLFSYIILSCWLLNWIFFGKKLCAALLFSGYFFAGITAFWLINPPQQGYFYIDNGRLSFLQVSLAFVTFAVLYILRKLSLSSFKQRAVGLLIAIIFAFTCVWFVFADALFANPISQSLYEIWGYRVGELKSPLKDCVSFSKYFILPIIVGWILLSLITADKTKAGDFFLWLPFMLFFFLGLYALRFDVYIYVFAMYPIAMYLRQKAYLAGLLTNPKALVPDKLVGIIFGLFFLPQFIPIIATTLCEDDAQKPVKVERVGDNEKIITYLQQNKGTVLSDVFRGPEIIWKTGCPVVGTPYHRNVEGITDTQVLFFTSDYSELLRLITKHKVKYILFPRLENNIHYAKPFDNLDKLYGKVMTGKGLPKWLSPVYEARQTGEYSLYKIDL